MPVNPSSHIVLYADDDTDDLLLLKDAFEKFAENIEVVTAYDGMEAVLFLKNLMTMDQVPCLIILDINMPRMNGKEALVEIRRLERFKEIPIVLFTTSSFESDKEFAVHHGAGFITKPLNSRQVKDILEQFISYCHDDVKKSLLTTHRNPI